MLAVILRSNVVMPNIVLPEFPRQKGSAHRFCALTRKTPGDLQRLFYGPVCGPRHSIRSLKNAVAAKPRDYDEVSESIGLPTPENGTHLPDQPSTFGTRMQNRIWMHSSGVAKNAAFEQCADHVVWSTER